MAKTWCAECGERQFDSPNGSTCANGHVGAPSRIESEALALGIDTTRRLRRVISVRQHDAPKRATIGRRPPHERELSDATCTPKWLADFLYETRGPFALDPCSNSRSHIIADWAYSLEKGLDGLKLSWCGDVFKNNPFSSPMVWQEKAVHEMSIGNCTELVELCKMDPSTDWWGVITRPIQRSLGEIDGIGRTDDRWWTPDLWLFNERIQYDEHPELIEIRRCKVASGERKGRKDGKSSNNFCSAMIHHRFDKPPLKLEKYATLWKR